MMTNIDVKIRNPYNNCILRKIIYHQYLPMLIDILDPLGAKTDRLRCEVCQNLILSPMNTGFLRPAVATVLTVHGIETFNATHKPPFLLMKVATVLTVHGIETNPNLRSIGILLHLLVATVLTVYGIETQLLQLHVS